MQGQIWERTWGWIWVSPARSDSKHIILKCISIYALVWEFWKLLFSVIGPVSSSLVTLLLIKLERNILWDLVQFLYVNAGAANKLFNGYTHHLCWISMHFKARMEVLWMCHYSFKPLLADDVCYSISGSHLSHTASSGTTTVCFPSSLLEYFQLHVIVTARKGSSLGTLTYSAQHSQCHSREGEAHGWGIMLTHLLHSPTCAKETCSKEDWPEERGNLLPSVLLRTRRDTERNLASGWWGPFLSGFHGDVSVNLI